MFAVGLLASACTVQRRLALPPPPYGEPLQLQPCKLNVLDVALSERTRIDGVAWEPAIEQLRSRLQRALSAVHESEGAALLEEPACELEVTVAIHERRAPSRWFVPWLLTDVALTAGLAFGGSALERANGGIPTRGVALGAAVAQVGVVVAALFFPLARHWGSFDATIVVRDSDRDGPQARTLTVPWEEEVNLLSREGPLAQASGAAAAALEAELFEELRRLLPPRKAGPRGTTSSPP